MRELYSFHWDCGRMGSLQGLFVAADALVKKSIGKRVDFDEALGKHSQIDGELEAADIELLTSDQDFINKLVLVTKSRIIGYENSVTVSGYNPLNNLVEEDED